MGLVSRLQRNTDPIFIVLDTNIILRDPGILGIWSQRVHLVVLDEVIEEVRRLVDRRRVSGELLNTLSIAFKARFITRPDQAVLAELPLTISTDQSLSQTDQTLLRYSLGLKRSGKAVALATHDRALALAAEEQGIDVMGHGELQRLLTATAAFGLSDLRVGETAQQYRRRILVLGIGIGAILSTVVILSFVYWRALLGLLTAWGAVVLVPIVGVGLYWVKARLPLAYGLAEVLVGLYTSSRLLAPGNHFESYGATEGLQIIGGLYIIVRGLDNCSRGVRGHAVERWWSVVFGGRSVKRQGVVEYLTSVSSGQNRERWLSQGR